MVNSHSVNSENKGDKNPVGKNLTIAKTPLPKRSISIVTVTDLVKITTSDKLIPYANSVKQLENNSISQQKANCIFYKFSQTKKRKTNKISDYWLNLYVCTTNQFQVWNKKITTKKIAFIKEQFLNH